MKDLPERGRIGIFNRSYYEDVLVVKVHPELLDQQKLPPGMRGNSFWEARYDDIAALERHLARNGTGDAAVVQKLSIAKPIAKQILSCQETPAVIR